MGNPFEELSAQLNRIEGTVNRMLSQPIGAGEILAKPVLERPIDVEEVALVLGISTSAVYQNIKVIPHYKRHGRLYFFESELLAYIKSEPETFFKTSKRSKLAKAA